MYVNSKDRANDDVSVKNFVVKQIRVQEHLHVIVRMSCSNFREIAAGFTKMTLKICTEDLHEFPANQLFCSATYQKPCLALLSFTIFSTLPWFSCVTVKWDACERLQLTNIVCWYTCTIHTPVYELGYKSL